MSGYALHMGVDMGTSRKMMSGNEIDGSIKGKQLMLYAQGIICAS